MELAALTYPELQAVLTRGAVALWPIGSTEAHGPHLPLDTDAVIAAETCRRAADPVRAATGLEAVVLPPLAFTITEFASPFAGTLSLPRETVVPYVRDVAIAAAAQGFKAVCLVNAHLEPAHRYALRDAAASAAKAGRCPVGVADPADRRFSSSLGEEFASGSCHAGSYETSLILAASEGRVREAARHALPRHEIDLVAEIRGGARTFVDAGAPEAYCGDPAVATAEEGEARYARLVEIVVAVLGDLLQTRSEDTMP